MVSILFVCMGNICRSPMAEGAFRFIATESGDESSFEIDSAGTLGYHAGSAPDPRAISAAQKKSIDIRDQQSRKVTVEDFEQFDYILGMDSDNIKELITRCPEEYQNKIQLFLPYAENLPLKEMPDPYYGPDDNFGRCLSAALSASRGLLKSIKQDQL